MSDTGNKPLKIGMLIYPDFTLQDLVGAQAVLGIHGQTFLLWKTMDPVMADTKVSINPTTLLGDCPKDLDVLFVPGGFGTPAIMEDDEIVDFLAEAGKTAKYITGVCNGTPLLGAAGLLNGYKAATHWSTYGALAESGAVPVHERVVTDRNRVTAGGVTSGIDFGITLLAKLRGDEIAMVTQLLLEYSPEPPFDTGTPERAGPEITAMAKTIFALPTLDADAISAIKSRAARRFKKKA